MGCAVQGSESRWRLDFPLPSRSALESINFSVQRVLGFFLRDKSVGVWRWMSTPLYRRGQRKSRSVLLLLAFMAKFTVTHIGSYLLLNIQMIADHSGRTVEGVGVQPLARWDCGFESGRGGWMDGWMSVVSVVCCWGRGLCDELITGSRVWRV